jgi:transposase IS116/IS110/IS902 family protein
MAQAPILDRFRRRLGVRMRLAMAAAAVVAVVSILAGGALVFTARSILISNVTTAANNRASPGGGAAKCRSDLVSGRGATPVGPGPDRGAGARRRRPGRRGLGRDRRRTADLRSATRARQRARAGTLDETLCEAVRDAVLALVTVLKALVGALKDLDRSTIATLGEHPDAQIFTSLPRSGQINAAQMLAEWGDCRQAYDSPDAIAALAGATPVTKQSGRYRAVHFRWACNKRFRVAITTFADNSRHASPWAAKVYADARARGHDHPHAIRVLARAWIRVIWRCWQNRTAYDPARHGNAVRLIQPGQNDLLAARG